MGKREIVLISQISWLFTVGNHNHNQVWMYDNVCVLYKDPRDNSPDEAILFDCKIKL